jgi:hypothetical protein
MGRPFTEQEREVVERLIELAPSEQRQSLRDGMANTEVGEKCSCGCGSFDIDYPGKVRGQHSLIAEGFVERAGQPLLSVMLFALHGRADYLELYAPEHVDGDPPIPLPLAREIRP